MEKEHVQVLEDVAARKEAVVREKAQKQLEKEAMKQEMEIEIE